MLSRSCCARCDRRRELPPECQRRHQLGASGDRASPSHGSRGPRHRPRHTARRVARRPSARRRPHPPGAVEDVPQGHVAAAGRAAAADGRRAAGIRARRGAPRVARAARLRRPARRPLPGRADGGRVPDRRRGFRRELRRRRDVAGRVGVDAASALTCRPHPGAVDVGDGKPGRHTASRECTTGVGASTSRASCRRRATTRSAPGGHPTGKPIVGFVGRLAPEKHVERLAGLAARDDLRVVVVGDGVDRAKLESLMPSAIFTGALYGAELAAAYASMDVFVHPGEHETFCQAVQEAMASGLPVHRARCGRTARSGHPDAHRAAAAHQPVRSAPVRRPSTT